MSYLVKCKLQMCQHHRRYTLRNHMLCLSTLTRARSLLFSSPSVSQIASPLSIFTRSRTTLAPKKVKNIKRHKGRVPIPTGGSTKGTTLAYGEWGIRICGNGMRLSAKQLLAAEEVIKKKLKVLKGSKSYLRVFPDIPVCIKVCVGLSRGGCSNVWDVG